MKFSGYLKRIGNFIRVNIRSLIISLLLSIVIWFAVSIQVFPNVYDHIYDIPVEVAQTPLMQEENLEIVDFSQTVNIQIMGKRYVIGTLSKDDFVATADLTTVTAPGKYSVNVQVKPINSNVECEIATESLQVVVNVERVVTKTFDLTADIDSISIADGLQVSEEDIVVTPSKVTITAEQSVINSISDATVKATTYSGQMAVTSEVKGELCLYKSDGTLIESPDIVTDAQNFAVTVPLWKVKTLPLNVSLDVPDGFDRDSLPYTVLPSEITIAAPASDNSIDNLDKIDVGEISLSDIASKDLQGIKLTIALPVGYRNLSNIAIAQVNFDEAAAYGKLDFTVPTENFSILNGDPDFDYSFVTSQLEVTAVGPSEVLKNLSAEDIKGTINLLGVTMEEGVRNVTVAMRIEGVDVTAWISGIYKIDVKATRNDGTA